MNSAISFILDNTSTIIAFASTITAFASFIVAFLFSRREAIRSDFDRVTKTIEYVTTGEIAECRHRLASFAIKDKRFDTGDLAAPDINKINTDYHDNNAADDAFKIIWALNYVRATHISLKPRLLIFWKSKPCSLLEDSLMSFITWHIGPLYTINNEALLIQIDKILRLHSGDLKKIKAWSESIYKCPCQKSAITLLFTPRINRCFCNHP